MRTRKIFPDDTCSSRWSCSHNKSMSLQLEKVITTNQMLCILQARHFLYNHIMFAGNLTSCTLSNNTASNGGALFQYNSNGKPCHPASHMMNNMAHRHCADDRSISAYLRRLLPMTEYQDSLNLQARLCLHCSKVILQARQVRSLMIRQISVYTNHLSIGFAIGNDMLHCA